jgi:hypothetical protein
MSALPDTAPTDQNRYVENPADIDNPILAFFLEYWRAKAGKHRMPSRGDINIRDFTKYLPWVILLDALDDLREFRFRVVGSRVSEYFLGDATGKTLTEVYSTTEPALLEGTSALLHRACELRAPTRATVPASTWQGEHFPDWDALYLPLATDHEAPDALLVVFTFNYEQFRRSRSLTSFRLPS